MTRLPTISVAFQKTREKRESQVFDNAIEQIVDVHWNKAVFDGFPIIPVPIKCSDHFASDHDKVHRFLKAPLKEIRDVGKYQEYCFGKYQEYRFEKYQG